jgi:GT2 family glycosyltransferase
MKHVTNSDEQSKVRAPERSRRFPAACTIISRNYLSDARVLASSYLQHHPGARFYTLVVDKLPEGVDAGPGISVVDPDELNAPYLSELFFKYSATELCTALKPSLLMLLLNRYHEEEVLYFDSDILVTSRFEALMACLPSANIVLTPHLLKPIPLDGFRPSEKEILIAGAYNAGFLALRKSDETQRFLHWWQTRLRDGCFIEFSEGLLTDQKWLDLVPALFEATIFKDETYNVAYWNIESRPIERKGDVFSVNGRPLAFFHFSGFNPANPTVFSTHQNRIRIVRGTALSDLVNRYLELQLWNGFETVRRWRYEYGALDNGTATNMLLRKLYADLERRERAPFGDPFRTGENSFFAWATRNDPATGGLSPFLKAVYNRRPDVMAVFPEVDGDHREAFLYWAYTEGAVELRYDPDAMRVYGDVGPPSSEIFAGLFDNGVPVNPPMRRLYFSLERSERDRFGNPLHATGDNSFFMWATRSDPEKTGLSPFLETVYKMRSDVMAEFPDPKGKDREGFLYWAYTAGAVELRYDPDAMRVYGDAGPPSFPRAQQAKIDETHPRADEGEVERRREEIGEKCSIIIPVYNKASLTRNCLDTLLSKASANIDFEVIVTDDASTDNTAEILRSYGDRIRVVTHEVNSGFSASCNDGAAIANGEYLVFLNNDTISQPGWLDALVRYADAHPEAAVVGGKLLFPNDTIQHAGLVICEDGEPRHIYTGFPADHPLVNRSRRLPIVTGACFLIRRQDFEQAQGFDLAFRNGYEDVDLCLRLGELGREVHYCHESVLYHLEAISRNVRAEEWHNKKLYRSRWAERVRPDEFHYYVQDGLLKIDYKPQYPIGLSVSPLLALLNGTDREHRIDRMLESRSQQVLGLLKDNIRLNVRVQEAELQSDSCNATGDFQRRRAHPELFSSPQVICRGEIRWLSNQSTGRLISIILPVKNGATKLRDLLPAIATQRSRDPIEIIAVDSGSTDESVELLHRANATVISIDPRSFNHGLTRNLAAQYTRGSIFVFLNQSTLPADECWLASLIAPFDRDPSLAGVCGRVLPRMDADLLSARDIARNINASTERIVTEITDWNYYHSLRGEALRRFVNFHSLSAAIRAEVFRRIPFREANFAEDLIWGKEALELGLRIQFEPSSVALHSHNYSVLDTLRRNFDDGVACRKIIGRTLDESDLVPGIVHEVRDDWRYLENECRLAPGDLEEWRLTSTMRRTAQFIGHWIGVNFDRAEGGPISMLSIVEQIKAGAKTEAPEALKTQNACSAR